MTEPLEELINAVFDLDISEAVFSRQIDPGAAPGSCTCYQIPAQDDYPAKTLCFKPGFLGTMSQAQASEFCPEEQRQYKEDGLAKRVGILRAASKECKTRAGGAPEGERWAAWFRCVGTTMLRMAREKS